MDLTVIGCCGSVPGPDSPASCYLLTRTDADGRPWRILLDLGSGAFGALQRHIDPGALDAVVLSHLHPDHCLDMTALAVHRAHGPAPADRALPVWGPPGTADRLARAYGVTQPKEPRGFTWYDLVDGEVFEIGPFRLTPVAVRHPVPAFGLRVEAGGTVLAYTGDTDSCPGLLRLMDRADLVLAEASFLEGRDTARGIHLTGRRAAEAAREAGAQRLMLTHLPPWQDATVVLEEARAVWDGPISLARPDSTTTL